MPKSSMAEIKLIIVVCGLMFLSFDSTTFAFPDFIQSNGLDINGSNVCQYPMAKARNMTILRQRLIKERYNTTCVVYGWPFIPNRPCTKTRIRLQSVYQLAVKTLYGYSLDCCLRWKKMGQNDTECLRAICVYGCKHGKCGAPDTCTCDPGWEGYTCSQDVDECMSSITNNCQHKCVNKPGSYECTCFKGFKYEKKTGMCEDLDECADSNGGCEHRCLNVYGSYRCSCRRGYLLALNRRKCWRLG